MLENQNTLLSNESSKIIEEAVKKLPAEDAKDVLLFSLFASAIIVLGIALLQGYNSSMKSKN